MTAALEPAQLRPRQVAGDHLGVHGGNDAILSPVDEENRRGQGSEGAPVAIALGDEIRPHAPERPEEGRPPARRASPGGGSRSAPGSPPPRGGVRQSTGRGRPSAGPATSPRR